MTQKQYNIRTTQTIKKQINKESKQTSTKQKTETDFAISKRVYVQF